jgi:hypothetical protein
MYARRWTIRENVFAAIHGRTAEARGAVFLWQESEDCVVERNLIVNCDSGVCLGNAAKPADVEAHARRCVVRNNLLAGCPQGDITAVYTGDCAIRQNVIIDRATRFRRLIRLVHDNDRLVVAQNVLVGAPVLVETDSRVEIRGNVTVP